MCSILGILDTKQKTTKLRENAIEMSKKQRHRGPDWSGVYQNDNAIFVHERLSIVDIDSGAQPILSKDGRLVLVVNGEIYNHKQLEKNLKINYDFQTKSDCEVINALYLEKGIDFLNDLNGIFAFILYDNQENRYIVARDHMGIIPLYKGYDEKGQLYISSEMKSISDNCKTIEQFTPGHYLDSKEDKMIKYYAPEWQKYNNVETNITDKKKLKRSLEDAVHRQLMSDVPYGVLLSGGLDSSIIAAITKKYSDRRIESGDIKDAWWPKLHSFAVGLIGAPDFKAAKEVADFIGSVHHEISFTIQEGLDALRDVIYHIETYDVTTIRSSTPMYLMARKIKSMGIKMVLSGEGADEIFGGYLYFHKAPNAKEFHEENVRKLNDLYKYDCLRANKSMAAWGLEARVPFLDKEFLDVAMTINPKDKMIQKGKLEKQILREIFSEYLPESIINRQKEQFSDGVGYSWIDKLKEFVEEHVSDEDIKNAKFKFPINTPLTKEAYFYRNIFTDFFPTDSEALTVPFEASVACSTAKALEWDATLKNVVDPSGRAVLSVHKESL